MCPENALEQVFQTAIARYEALQRVSHKLAEDDNLIAVLQTIADVAGSTVGANLVTIHSFDLLQQKVELIVHSGLGAGDLKNTGTPPNVSLDESRPWFWEGSSYGLFQSHDQLVWPVDQSEPVPWTVITVPIVFCERIFGILKVSNPAGHPPFTKVDESFLTTLSNLAAIAVENEHQKRAERQQRRQAETLREVSRILSYSLDQQNVLELILDQLARVVEFDSASVMLISDQQVRMVAHRKLQISKDLNVPEYTETYPHIKDVLEYRRPIIIDDTLQDSRWKAVNQGSSTRSWLGVPLIGRDQVIGLLNLDNEKPGFYTQQDAALAITFANQAVIAIENARLYTAERNRVEQLDALRATIVDISTELDLPRLLHAILQRAVKLVNATGGDLGLLDDAHNEIRIVASHNMGKDHAGVRLKIGEDALGQAVLKRRPVIIENYSHWEKAATHDRNDNWQTVLAVPFLIGRRIAGAFGIVDQDSARRFTSSDQHLISHFAQHAAIAVENARLYHSAREAAERRATLHQVSQAIVAASMQPEDIYTAIQNAAGRLMPVEAFAIVQYKGEKQLYERVYLIEDGMVIHDQAASIDCGLSRLIISTGRSHYIPKTSESELHSDIIHLNDLEQDSSVLAAPMRLRGNVVGMLAVQTYKAEAYSSEDIYLLEMLASYAAIALDNATLLQSIQQLAITDPLTGINNRRHLFELGQREFLRAKRYSRPISAIMIDIDRFKRINDLHGHARGDAVLVKLSGLLITGVREFDIVGRYGGEEFVIILPETTASASYEVAERLRILINKAFDNTEIPMITASIGVASSRPETPDLEALVHMADIAMYAAKTSGGDRVASA